MLPRSGRPHDQLLRTIWVAAIGGLVVGHILWLVAISLAIATTHVNRYVLVVAAAFAVVTVVAVLLGWRFHERKLPVWSAFLWCLPISPVLLTLCVLGVTYL